MSSSIPFRSRRNAESRPRRFLIGVVVLSMLSLVGLSANAETSPEVEEAVAGLVSKSRATISKSIGELGRIGDVSALPALEALERGQLRSTRDGRVVILDEAETTVRDALTGLEIPGQAIDDLDKPRINNSVRRALKPVLGQLALVASDPEVRRSAVMALIESPSVDSRDALRLAREVETESELRSLIEVALAQLDLKSEVTEERIAAVQTLGSFADPRVKSELEGLLRKTNEEGGWVESDPEVRAAAEKALKAIGQQESLRKSIGNFLYGLSLASILLLAALGLAITFGLMGVINMAHGEMLMLGAYTTYAVQGFFNAHIPDWSDAYVLAAIPAAFVVCGTIGMAIERSVIRFLYGRPLETLLATWGISLILIQTVRLIFGAQNVEVSNPTWLSGGYPLMSGLILPWSRIGIIGFAVAVVLLTWLLLQRTPLGLRVRAVQQNRSMAACLGIATARIDMWTFGLGSAIAGLGGVALSQVGNVGPELGQSYIVDSFLVVVLGGVGKLAGTVVAAIGLGIVNKFLEPVSGAVLGKIFVLGFIILFIQRRPQGIFAMKGRAAEA